MGNNSKIGWFELNRISANRNNRKPFDELTENINIPDSRSNIQREKYFSKTVNFFSCKIFY
jgi:hypothetical protein